MTRCSNTAPDQDTALLKPETLKSHYQNDKFINDTPRNDPSFGKKLSILWSMLTTPKVNTVSDQPIPVRPITAEQLLALPKDRDFLFRLGHSSILLVLDGELWLLDPWLLLDE